MASALSNPLLSAPAQMFLMCCDMRSFTAAAKALGITQSAVSKTMMRFESEMGFELFVRNSRPLALTPEAVLLYQDLKGVKGELGRSLSALKNRNFIRPVLKIGILESLHLHLGPEIIQRLAPEVSQIMMITGSANVLMQRLLERKLDLIITNVVTSEKARIFCKKLFEEPSVLMLPKSFSKQEQADHLWSWRRLALCGLPLISYWKETGAGEINDMFLRSYGLSFPEKISVDTNSLMVRLIAGNVGWGFSRPTTVYQNLYMLKDILVRPMQEPKFSREVFIIGREKEFTFEADALHEVCAQYVERSLIPEILKFAPWAEGDFRVFRNAGYGDSEAGFL